MVISCDAAGKRYKLQPLIPPLPRLNFFRKRNGTGNEGRFASAGNALMTLIWTRQTSVQEKETFGRRSTFPPAPPPLDNVHQEACGKKANDGWK